MVPARRREDSRGAFGVGESLTSPFPLLAFLLHSLYGKATHLHIHTYPQILKAGPPRNRRKSHGRHRNRRLQVGSKGEACRPPLPLLLFLPSSPSKPIHTRHRLLFAHILKARTRWLHWLPSPPSLSWLRGFWLPWAPPLSHILV